MDALAILTRRWIKCVALVAVLMVAVILGFAPQASAIDVDATAEPAPLHLLDMQPEVAVYTRVALERGPPASYVQRTTRNVSDHRAHGTSARSRDSATPVGATYDHTAPFVPIARLAATTEGTGQVAWAQLSLYERWQVAAKAAPAAGQRTTAVIGRQADTAVAKNWPGHEVLNLPADKWSLARNDQWVQSVVDRKMPVYVGSPTTWPNLWDASAGRATVFGRELQQFTNAGYTWDGWTLIPPGAG